MDRTEQNHPPETDTRARQQQVREVAQAVKTINQSGQLGPEHELTIALHRDTGQPVVRIVDRNTHEVIQQIPDERVLRMAEEFKRAQPQQQQQQQTTAAAMIGRNLLGI